MKFKILFLCLWVFIVCTGFIKPISVGLEELPKADRWLAQSDGDKQRKMKTSKDPLLKSAIASALENWDVCVTEARKVSPKSVVYDWALMTELNCAKDWADQDPKVKSGKTPGAQLAESLRRAEASSFENVSRTAEERRRDTWAAATMTLLKWNDKHAQWKDQRLLLQKAFKKENFFSKADRAQIYYYAGNALVADRQWADAFWHFQRAHDLNPDAGNIDARVRSILPMIPANLRESFEKAIARPEPETTPVVLNPSQEELEIYNQGEGYLLRNDPIAAVEALGKLLRKFPGGIKAKWAQDKIYDLFVQEIDRSKGPNGVSVAKKRIMTEMLEDDAERQVEWAGALFSAQAYADSAPLYKKAAQVMAGSSRASKYFYMAGRSFQLSGDAVDAREMYQTVVKNYPSAPEVVDAAIQWGLVDMGENDPSEAITHLEVARSRRMTNQQDLISLFWLYEAYKAKNAEGPIGDTSGDLIRRFGLTYYGIIASFDLKKELPQFEKSKTKSGKVYWSDAETSALERARALLGSGMLEAASDELGVFQLRTLNQAEEQYLANFYSQALKYPKTFGLLGDIIDGAPEKKTDYIIHQIFPKEFWEYVNDDKKRSELDPFLLLSVMKQESAFDPTAQSRSGALGLLQMIPPTALEVKQELNSNADIPRDLSNPATNIRFCAYYLSKLIKKFGGSVPLALAAYNAGPARITQFVAAKPGGLKDTWVDELPWAETSFYVKSILKNYIMYRQLYGGLTQLPTPPWSH